MSIYKMFAIPEDFKKFLNEMHEAIVRGEHKLVRERLQSINLSDLPRSCYLELAQLAYRIGTTTLTIKLLGSLMKNGRKAYDPITDKELAEYAMALVQIGASTEAIRWLRDIDKTKTPRALLYEAFASITEWNYE